MTQERFERVQRTQKEFWNALRELEKDVGRDLSSTQDFNNQTLETMENE